MCPSHSLADVAAAGAGNLLHDRPISEDLRRAVEAAVLGHGREHPPGRISGGVQPQGRTLPPAPPEPDPAMQAAIRRALAARMATADARARDRQPVERMPAIDVRHVAIEARHLIAEQAAMGITLNAAQAVAAVLRGEASS